jgi:nitrate reductase NapE component
MPRHRAKAETRRARRERREWIAILIVTELVAALLTVGIVSTYR